MDADEFEVLKSKLQIEEVEPSPDDEQAYWEH